MRYLTIGEIAKITNLPIRTLHYYDQIDLFKPLLTERYLELLNDGVEVLTMQAGNMLV